jgi:hypothetical protein
MSLKQTFIQHPPITTRLIYCCASSLTWSRVISAIGRASGSRCSSVTAFRAGLRKSAVDTRKSPAHLVACDDPKHIHGPYGSIVCSKFALVVARSIGLPRGKGVAMIWTAKHYASQREESVPTDRKVPNCVDEVYVIQSCNSSEGLRSLFSRF